MENQNGDPSHSTCLQQTMHEIDESVAWTSSSDN